MARFSLLTTAVAGLVAAAVANAQAMVNTPTGLITCQPSLIQWSGGAAPYYVSVIPGGEPNGALLKTLVDGGSATQYTWNVDLPAGTSITIQIKDASGSTNYSDKTTIGAGSDTSCVNNNVVIGGSSSAAAATSSAAAGASGAALSAAASGSSRASGAAASASSAVTSATPGSAGQATIGGRSAVGALVVAAAVAALA